MYHWRELGIRLCLPGCNGSGKFMVAQSLSSDIFIVWRGCTDFWWTVWCFCPINGGKKPLAYHLFAANVWDGYRLISRKGFLGRDIGLRFILSPFFSTHHSTREYGQLQYSHTKTVGVASLRKRHWQFNTHWFQLSSSQKTGQESEGKLLEMRAAALPLAWDKIIWVQWILLHGRRLGLGSLERIWPKIPLLRWEFLGERVYVK